MKTTPKVKNSGDPIMGVEGQCEIYLKELDHVPSVNVGEKSPWALAAGEKGHYFKIHQNEVSKRSSILNTARHEGNLLDQNLIFWGIIIA